MGWERPGVYRVVGVRMDHVRRFDVRVHAGVGLVAAVARHVVLRQGVRPGAPPLAVRLQLSLQRVLPPSLRGACRAAAAEPHGPEDKFPS